MQRNVPFSWLCIAGFILSLSCAIPAMATEPTTAIASRLFHKIADLGLQQQMNISYPLARRFYDEVASDVTLFAATYPDSPLPEKFHPVMRIYTDIYRLWGQYTDAGENEILSDNSLEYQVLNQRYPLLFSRLATQALIHPVTGQTDYRYPDIVRELTAHEAAQAQQELQALLFRIAQPPTILFGRHQSNVAWGRLQRGWFIGGDGRIMSYTLSAADFHEWKEPDSDGYISRSDLEANYALATREITTLPPEEINTKAALLAHLAGNSRLSPEIHIGSDMGKTDTVAYWWDAQRGRYRQILLFRQGDSRQTNESPYAPELIQWLTAIQQKTY
ncbi:MAG TPA: hypothetical protein VN611_17720 [Patescibacteria group bacterium]|nr:hypothetical protein [Patescibacteria group bacterium]